VVNDKFNMTLACDLYGMVGYQSGMIFGMINDSILIDGNMMLVWLARNSTIVSWWCLIG